MSGWCIFRVMTGGSHIRAVGQGSGAEAPMAELGDAVEPLTLDERWAEDAPVAGDWEEPVHAPRGRWLAPVMALLAIAAWTGFFGWAHLGTLRGGIEPLAASDLIVDWAVPV